MATPNSQWRNTRVSEHARESKKRRVPVIQRSRRGTQMDRSTRDRSREIRILDPDAFSSSDPSSTSTVYMRLTRNLRAGSYLPNWDQQARGHRGSVLIGPTEVLHRPR